MDELIKRLKKAQGDLSQNEFAEKCGISSSNLSRIYQKKQKPSPELLKKIGMGLNVEGLYEDLMIAAGYWEGRGIFQIIPDIFRNRLKELRKSSGESLEDVALRVGIPISTLEAYESGECLPSSLIDIIPLAKYFEVFTEYLTGQAPYTNEAEYSEYVSKQEVLISNLDRFPDQISKEIVTMLNMLFRILLFDYNKKSDRALKLAIPHLKALLEVCSEIYYTYIFCLNSETEDSKIANLRKICETEPSDNAVDTGEVMFKYILAHLGQRDANLLGMRQMAEELISKVEEDVDILFKEYSPTVYEILGLDEDDEESPFQQIPVTRK